MAFRKRNIVIGRTPGGSATSALHEKEQSNISVPGVGVRPSPLTSHAVTSTGTPSLDGLMDGHGGLTLGSSLLIEESGTTDFAGALLKYYAAEGICQGHVLHIVGLNEGWIRELPGVSDTKDRNSSVPREDEDRMKIAWRYKNLGQASERDRPTVTNVGRTPQETLFCHAFDLTKRLVIPPDTKINYMPFTNAPLASITQTLSRSIAASPSNGIHRLIIPSILSPALYPPSACRPENFLNFFLALRSLLRQNPTRLTAMLTLPLSLHPRTSALVHWAEILSDGVLELTPFPHSSTMDEVGSKKPGSDDKSQPQGLVRVHKLPITTERGEGGAGANNSIGDDLAFTVSRRKFAIAAFALPPVEGDSEAQAERRKQDVEF